jgi:DNA polymerase III delta prime subunit
MLDNHAHIQSKLDYFISSKKIPNIIFHGSSGSGKRTIADNFLYKIYDGNREKMKKQIMTVECSHGKGIKFIREDLKFFAKSHIQSNQGANFKSIVLLNADSLTIDAQSALRRCIELFSHNTRFFIVVENRERLLNPILSRFCEIYVSPFVVPINSGGDQEKYQEICEKYSTNNENFNETAKQIINDATEWCEAGYSALKWIECLNASASPNKTMITMCYHKIKPDFRSEKLLVYYTMYFTFVSSNEDLENILVS